MILLVAGSILIVVGILMFIRLFRYSRKPRVEYVRVIETFMDFPTYKGKQGPRQFRHARVEYYYKSVRYQSTTALKSKAEPGQNIRVSLNEADPTKIEEYYPVLEFIWCGGVTLVGVILVLLWWIIYLALTS